jgi:hypothetical protein
MRHEEVADLIRWKFDSTVFAPFHIGLIEIMQLSITVAVSIIRQRIDSVSRCPNSKLTTIIVALTLI